MCFYFAGELSLCRDKKNPVQSVERGFFMVYRFAIFGGKIDSEVAIFRQWVPDGEGSQNIDGYFNKISNLLVDL